MSRPVALRHAGKPVGAALTLRGGSAVLERDGRRLDATVSRRGAWIDILTGSTGGTGGGTVRCATARNARGIWVACEGRTYLLEIEHREAAGRAVAGAADEIRAPMTGRVIAVTASPGAAVKEGDLLLTIEAMKMEFKLPAPEDGTVLDVSCAAGDLVELGQLLVRLKPASAAEGSRPGSAGAGEA